MARKTRKLFEDRMFDVMFQAEALGHKLTKFKDRRHPHNDTTCPMAKCKCGMIAYASARGEYTGSATLNVCPS